MVAQKEKTDNDTNFDAQNRFFFEHYRKLKDLALFPYTGWHTYDKNQNEKDSLRVALKEAAYDINLKRNLTPILAPATIVTSCVALVLGVALAFCHFISCVVSALMDSPATTLSYSGLPMIPILSSRPMLL